MAGPRDGLRSVILLIAALASGCGSPRAATQAPVPPPRFAPVTHGVSAGDVTDTRAVIWARTDRYAEMHVDLFGGDVRRHASTWAVEARDFAAKVVVESLAPGTDYHYRVWFSPDGRADPPPPGLAADGHFRTAPAANAAAAVTFGWSGDLAGLNVCRDVKEGYPIFRTMRGESLDFFVGLGDMIYGDQRCDARGFYGNAQIPRKVPEATTVREYWAHWKYNREDEGFRRFLSAVGYVAVWDDHEVVNDFGPTDAWHAYPPYAFAADLLPLGRAALFDYNPIGVDGADPNRIYRAFRWGRHVDLVVLDTRSYRSPNPDPDTAPTPKTMLGAAQRDWLSNRVARSDATWEILISSVPISVPTGRGGTAGHDGWAGYDLDVGYERELAGLFRSFRDAGVHNLVFLTTDVHFATGFRYTPFPETPDFVVYEFTAGPLGAMLLPTHSADDTFHPERLFFYGPDGQPKSFADATAFMNWGRIAVSPAGQLAVSVVNGLGKTVVEQTFAPRPRGRFSGGPSGAAAPEGATSRASLPPP